MLLKHLLEQKLPKTVIARRLGISRRLVYHLIKTGQLDRSFDRDLSAPLPPPPRERRPNALVIEPYKPIITTRLETYPELSAVRLFEECRLAGYAGSLTQLKVFVREVRPTPPVEEIVRFETDPGRQAQADFAEFRFPWGKRYALLVVLGYSRLLWIKFYPRQTMQVVIAGLEEAFGYFGGVPKEILFDQMKAVIIGDERLKGG
ncbi:MAG: DDE-type integrase/transposase/recombinase, partial [Gemmatimonadaceae bacterium]